MPTRVLHISDTHFTSGLREKDKSLYQKLVLRGGLRSHDFQVVSALSAKLHRIMFQFGRFDLVVVTGDVSTDGAVASMNTAHDFLSKGEIYSDDPGHFIVNGLDLVTDAAVVVPGNHDRYVANGLIPIPLQLNFGNFESVFGSPSYPFVFGLPKPTQEEPKEDADLIVFAFDSTAVNQPPFGHSPSELIAKGFVDNQACDWLQLKAEQIAAEGKVAPLRMRKTIERGKLLQKDLIPVNFDECVKIVALHHHPIDLSPGESGLVPDSAVPTFERRNAQDPSSLTRWTTLENRDRFLEACFSAKIDLVLFGHQHRHLHRELDESMGEIPSEAASIEARGIHFLCCPTSTQLSRLERGFFIYSIQPGHFDVEFYSWNEEDFQFTQDRQRSGRFAFHRGRIAFSKSAGPSSAL